MSAELLPIVDAEQKRQCGECTACCTAVGVAELGKPFFESCEHVCENGCKIYAERPESCRKFECFWLRGILSDECRPDKFGWVFCTDSDEVLDAYAVRPDVTWNDDCRRAAKTILDYRNELTIATQFGDEFTPEMAAEMSKTFWKQMAGVQIFPFGDRVVCDFATRAPYSIHPAGTGAGIQYKARPISFEGRPLVEICVDTDPVPENPPATVSAPVSKPKPERKADSQQKKNRKELRKQKKAERKRRRNH